MTGPGKYLYCIIACAEARTFEDVVPVGNGDGVVHTVPHNGLAAVVSESPSTEYESTRANMVAHERIQERVMREYTLLPVRFGTVARSASPIQAIGKLLEKRSREFEQRLGEVAGKVELGVKALWREEKAVYEEILVENAAIRRLRNSLTGRPAAALRFEALPLGEMVKDALEQKKKREAMDLLAPLRRIACGVRENDIIVDRMVLNAAFLTDEDRQEEMDRAVSKLDDELGRRLSFRYTGPNPPWNFVEIVVNWKDILQE